jgi:dehydrogenase/reductase SDR family protein 7B
MHTFQNKIAIVTGGTSGIGKALVHELSLRGAKVVFSGRDLERVLLVEKEFKSKQLEVLGVVADVTSEIDSQILIDRTLKSFGKIDILINNAGISMRALFEDLQLDVIKKVMDINFYGMLHSTKAALPHILSTQGSIVGISSIAGYRGLPARTGYSASKFAMQGFLEALRTELISKNVHVLTACPGFTSSNIRNQALGANGQSQKESPLDEQNIMSAEEVAQKIADAIYNRKRDLVLTTQGKLTVFLNKLFPGWMDRMVYKHFLKEKDSPLK